jgi:PAS domain S-box-containing protein
MSWSQPQLAGDAHDQLTILIGSAIQLLRGRAGVFVVANEAFDPQSSAEHIRYQIREPALSALLAYVQEGMQPNSLHPLVFETLAPDLARRMAVPETVLERQGVECGSLAVYDLLGPLGVLHFWRPVTARSCFEYVEADGVDEAPHTLAVDPAVTDADMETRVRHDAGAGPGGPSSSLRLFIAQLATSLRFAFKSQSLLKEQARLAAIFQHSTDGILTVDHALRIIDFNPAMERLTGWRESEVLGQFYFTVLRPQDRHGNELGLEDSPILQTFSGREVVDKEMIISARDGQRFTVAATASCVRSLRGEPMNGILNVRDLTRERQQEEQRSTFISVISHELKTPIAIIKGYASTLARSDARLDASALRSRLVAVEEEADRLDKLVGNLLYASRIQANGLQMDISALELGPLIRSVTRRLRAKVPNVQVTLSIPSSLPAVMADRDRIEEVLQNLLDNAIKYSPHQPRISIAGYATGEEVIVSVSDSGMGISLREQEQIFDRFQRSSNPSAQTMSGAGLGLYICRAIVEAHGGYIWVESTLREGSTFSFSLPREEKAPLPMVVF